MTRINPYYDHLPCRTNGVNCRLCYLFENDSRYTKLWHVDNPSALRPKNQLQEVPIPSTPIAQPTVRPHRKLPTYTWAYGVTTVPDRFSKILPRTLESLRLAGFDTPWLFIDGGLPSEIPNELKRYSSSCRYPKVKTFGNWMLGMWELYLRSPIADRYAMFQDDFVTYPDLRKYLDWCDYPAKGYWNLYTMPANQERFPLEGKTNRQRYGWMESNGKGLGAVATVFSRDALVALLTHYHMVERPQTAGTRSWKAVDGGIVTALKKAGYAEYVHNPSLTQHTGIISTMGNRPQPFATSFRGEHFNALDLIHEVSALPAT